MPADSIAAMLRRNRCILMSHKIHCERISQGGDPSETNGGDIVSELGNIDKDLREAEAYLNEEHSGSKLIEEIRVMLDFKRELELAFNEIFGNGIVPTVNIRDVNVRTVDDDRLV